MIKQNTKNNDTIFWKVLEPAIDKGLQCFMKTTLTVKYVIYKVQDITLIKKRSGTLQCNYKFLFASKKIIQLKKN